MKTNLLPLALPFALLLTSCAKNEAIAPSARPVAVAKDQPVISCTHPENAMIGHRFALTWMNGYAVEMPTGTERPWLRLSRNGGNVLEGRTGCNDLAGIFDLRCEHLSFHNISTSEIYCYNTESIERQFLQALDEIDGYVINGKDLQLIRGHTVFLKLRVVYHLDYVRQNG